MQWFPVNSNDICIDVGSAHFHTNNHTQNQSPDLWFFYSAIIIFHICWRVIPHTSNSIGPSIIIISPNETRICRNETKSAWCASQPIPRTKSGCFVWMPSVPLHRIELLIIDSTEPGRITTYLHLKSHRPQIHRFIHVECKWMNDWPKNKKLKSVEIAGLIVLHHKQNVLHICLSMSTLTSSPFQPDQL